MKSSHYALQLQREKKTPSSFQFSALFERLSFNYIRCHYKNF